jgi:hypothetical protein
MSGTVADKGPEHTPGDKSDEHTGKRNLREDCVTGVLADIDHSGRCENMEDRGGEEADGATDEEDREPLRCRRPGHAQSRDDCDDPDGDNQVRNRDVLCGHRVGIDPRFGLSRDPSNTTTMSRSRS